MKMKKQDLFVTFLSLVAFRLGEGRDPGPLGLPIGLAYDCNFNPISDIKILCAFLLVCPCVYVNATLIFYDN